MTAANEVGQPVISTVHLADDIGTRPQIAVDITVPAEKVVERLIDIVCDIAVQRPARRQGADIDRTELSQRRANGRPVAGARRQRPIIEPAAEHRIRACVEIVRRCFLRRTPQIGFTVPLQQRLERAIRGAPLRV